MDVREALLQIEEIHRHLERTVPYRGYRSVTIAMTGAIALLGAAAHALLVDDFTGEFVRFWLALAIVNLVLVLGEIAWDYRRLRSSREQQLTRRVVAQFLPSLSGGALVTFALQSAGLVVWLPGLWAILFSMGVFASRPYLPHGVGWVGLFYLGAGGALLALAPFGLSLHPWGMGSAFGVGQIWLALVLYWDLERNA